MRACSCVCVSSNDVTIFPDSSVARFCERAPKNLSDKFLLSQLQNLTIKSIFVTTFLHNTTPTSVCKLFLMLTFIYFCRPGSQHSREWLLTLPFLIDWLIDWFIDWLTDWPDLSSYATVRVNVVTELTFRASRDGITLTSIFNDDMVIKYWKHLYEYNVSTIYSRKSVCLFVCLFFMHSDTVRAIITKLSTMLP